MILIIEIKFYQLNFLSNGTVIINYVKHFLRHSELMWKYWFENTSARRSLVLFVAFFCSGFRSPLRLLLSFIAVYLCLNVTFHRWGRGLMQILELHQKVFAQVPPPPPPPTHTHTHTHTLFVPRRFLCYSASRGLCVVIVAFPGYLHLWRLRL